MIRDLLHPLVSRDPAPAAVADAFDHLLSADADDVGRAALLVALARVPVDGERLAAAAARLRRHRLAVRPVVEPRVDTCGTGGDGFDTMNLSTAAAFVVASLGGACAKHGNRAVSSRCGSADVLEALGFRLELDPDTAARSIDACGFAFLYAARFHPGMARLHPVRRRLGIPTLVNLVGPLANPALAEHQLLGVRSRDLLDPFAEALLRLDAKRALVVHCAGLDEVGLHDVTEGRLVADGRVRPFAVEPERYGIDRAPPEALCGGEPRQNAELLRAVLSGEDRSPRADAVLLNAAAAAFAAGLVDAFEDGVDAAREALARGRPWRVLERARELSHSGATSAEARP